VKPTVTLFVNIHPCFSEVASFILQPKVTQLLDFPTTSEIRRQSFRFLRLYSTD